LLELVVLAALKDGKPKGLTMLLGEVGFSHKHSTTASGAVHG
jgi:hypothetical protein